MLVAVHEVGIDVVRLRVVIVPSQPHSGVVVAQHISVTVLEIEQITAYRLY